MDKMITEFTEEQTAMFPVYVKQWTDIGLCTDPADRPRAEAAIKQSYELQGLTAPQKVIWSGSPFSQGVLRGIMQNPKKREQLLELIKTVKPEDRELELDDFDPIVDQAKEIVFGSKEILESLRNSVYESIYGQHDANWLAFYAFFREVMGLIEETDKLQGLTELAKSAGWCIPHENVCFASERPSLLNRDEEGRLHCLTGPALLYPDGWTIYAVHGIRVKEHIIMRPEEITVDSIEKESNAEIRRIMVDRYDRNYKGQFIEDSGAVKIHEDEKGELFIKDMGDGDRIAMVKVKNTTPNPDGSRKEYYLYVDPTVTTAKAGVASTFERTEEQYDPIVET